MGAQRSPALSYPVSVTLTRPALDPALGVVVGTISYPSFPCGGQLGLIAAGGDELLLAERLTTGLEQCTDQGRVTLSRRTEQRLFYTWTLPDDPLAVTAQLLRDEATPGSVRDRLPRGGLRQHLHRPRRRVDAQVVARAQGLLRARLQAVQERHAGQHGALHHHRVGGAEEEGQGGHPPAHHVQQHPGSGDAPFGRGADQHLPHHAVAAEVVGGAGEDPPLAVEVVAGAEALAGDERLPLHHRAHARRPSQHQAPAPAGAAHTTLPARRAGLTLRPLPDARRRRPRRRPRWGGRGGHTRSRR